MKSYFYPWENGEKHNVECVLALGFFDGVHAAHRELILSAKAAAKKLGLPLGIFTFRTGTAIKSAVRRLYGEDEKLELFESLGADFVISADFDKIKDISPEDFVKANLYSDIGCILCVAGFNFRFGRGAQGDADMLTRLMRECGGDALIKNELKIDGETVSATGIRALIEHGEIERANELLGAPYFLCGAVEHGRSVGTELGFPTVNMELGDDRVPLKRGVYRSAVMIDGKLYNALTNIGTCPTFDERREHAETYILDFSGDLYGRRLRVYLLGFLREEKRFESAGELAEQIKQDIKEAKNRNGETKWQVLGQS
ncbi:MAG: riboflavin biosynthesis protein RibF [Clostridia bacterium]|nr:riboflavin biosynthesis protein RibF [Clostridia bacterium]